VSRETASETIAKPVRTFVCIEVPASIRERIGETQKQLRNIGSRVSWANTANIHLTMKFLGDVPVARLPKVFDAVDRAVIGVDEFEIEVGGTGCFPSPRRPRVLWIGIHQPSTGLMELHTSVEEQMVVAGFPPEGKRYSPHLTIGRVREPERAADLGEALVAASFPPERFLVRHVIVMRSDLRPTGSVYTPQHKASLQV
jgi:2'-5' RNA ligase